MTRKQKKRLIRIGISLAFFTAGLLTSALFSVSNAVSIISFILLMASYLIVGFEVLKEAAHGIIHGQLFDENFLMTIATIGALIIGEYHEAAAVMLFYQIGEWFQSYAVGKSRASIADLMDIRPETADVERNGSIETVDPEEVSLDEIIIIRAGERIPLDGIIVEGQSALDTSALTGESLPRDVKEGEAVISGCINLSGQLRVRVTKEYCDSTVARILELVENASDKKAKVESFITRYARVYTPVVCALALLLALLPPLLTGGSWSEWAYRALSFLVVSCPCALVISVPLGFFGGIGAASRCGILVKGSNQLEALAKAKIAVFDKTGTLTEGRFRVTAIHPVGMDAEKLLRLAAIVEAHSNHPISQSICEAAGVLDIHDECHDVQEIAGHGICAAYQECRLAAGNQKLMASLGVTIPDGEIDGTVVHIAMDQTYLGSIVVADVIKSSTVEALAQLKKEGISRTVMLTGDQKTVAARIVGELGIDEFHAQLLPEDKLNHLERLLTQKEENEVLVFVGDGINDAPVLTRADVGVAMGALGSDAAVEAADIVLMDDDPRKLAKAVQISRRTLAIVRQNIVFALGVKLLVLALVAIGAAGMWLAVFADVGVSVIAILNAMRALRS
ncbi:MAG: cadmium-translocating P-type ATPase [Clostridia bacterium]|nr:cadmium-translocating P-type ATPase [Clostridia bacterium]